MIRRKLLKLSTVMLRVHNIVQSRINEYGWAEDALEFAEGNVAMLMEFPERTSCLSDRKYSSVAGKVGYETIPGKCPVIGGWLFGINKKSKKTQSAF